MLLTREPPQSQGHTCIEREGMGKRYFRQMEMTRKRESHYSCQTKQAETKAIKKDKEGCYLIIKGSIQEEALIPIHIYAPHIGGPKYIKQRLIEEGKWLLFAGRMTMPTFTWGGLSFSLNLGEWTQPLFPVISLRYTSCLVVIIGVEIWQEL